jgi:hypothetical protein
MSYPGNISVTEISSIITPILSNLPPQFNATYVNNGLLDADEIQPLNGKKFIIQKKISISIRNI